MNNSNTPAKPIPTTSQPLPRWAWGVGGVMLLAVAGLASALVYRADDTAGEAAQANTALRLAEAPKKAARAAQVPPRAPACADCGVVESVRAVQRKGEGSGVGVVAGSVLGGVVGNQMGGGNGKTAMTVLGAIGGGMAGNEVEKRSRAVTVYEVSVRMDDGSRRSLTLPSAGVVSGDRVAVDGRDLRRLPAGSNAS